MKTLTNLTLILLLIISTLFVISCEKTTDPDGTSQGKITYIGHTSVREFTLVVDEILETRAYTIPKVDDEYTLKSRVPSTSTTRTKTGTIAAVDTTNAEYIEIRLVPSADTSNLRVRVSRVAPVGMTGIYGTVVWSDGGTPNTEAFLLPLIIGELVPSVADNTLTAVVTSAAGAMNNCEFLVNVMIDGLNSLTTKVELTAISTTSINSEQVAVDVQSTIGNFLFIQTSQDQEGGKYYRVWQLTCINDFTPGSSIDITLIHNGTPLATEMLSMVYIPTFVNPPTTFNRAVANTFNWTISSYSEKQQAICQWLSSSGYDEQLFPLAYNAVTCPVPANTVPSDWSRVWFDVYEINSKTIDTDDITFVTSRIESLSYNTSGIVTAPDETPRNRNEAEQSIRIYNLIKSSN